MGPFKVQLCLICYFHRGAFCHEGKQDQPMKKFFWTLKRDLGDRCSGQKCHNEHDKEEFLRVVNSLQHN